MSQEGPVDTAQTVSKSSTAFLSGTFLSRIGGLGRDTAMAFAFGSHPAIAAFMVAFRFANLIRRLFGEGPLPAGFIPHYEQLRGLSSLQAAKFFRDFFFSLSTFLFFLIGGLEMVMWCVWKWGHLHPDNAHILSLMMIMLPGVLFICLFGLSSGLLQCERRFFLTGFAPVAFNVVWMIAAFMLMGSDPDTAVVPLSFAIIIAFLMQWGMLAPKTFAVLRQHLTWKECFSPDLFSTELRRIVKPLFLSIIGVGAVQINSALDAVFARYASLEGPAYLWYAIRIEQVPLAFFGIALSAALLPPLSRALKEKAYERYTHLLQFALRRSFSLIFPCTLGLFVLGVAGINLLYGHGEFSSEATYQTTLCLWGYGLGLIPAVFVLLLAPAFYAGKDYRVPMIGSVVSVVFNVALTAFFVFALGWGVFSISIATSLAAWYNYFYLSRQLYLRIQKPVLNLPLFTSFFKTAACTLLAAGASLLVGHFLIDDPTLQIAMGESGILLSRQFSIQSMQFLALAGTFAVVLFSYAWLFNAQDVLELIGLKSKC